MNILLLFLSTPSARRATYRGNIFSRLVFEFLSTPSARRATNHKARDIIDRHISIHALREEGDAVGIHNQLDPVISIHALREEGDPLHGAQ